MNTPGGLTAVAKLTEEQLASIRDTEKGEANVQVRPRGSRHYRRRHRAERASLKNQTLSSYAYINSTRTLRSGRAKVAQLFPGKRGGGGKSRGPTWFSLFLL